MTTVPNELAAATCQKEWDRAVAYVRDTLRSLMNKEPDSGLVERVATKVIEAMRRYGQVSLPGEK